MNPTIVAVLTSLAFSQHPPVVVHVHEPGGGPPVESAGVEIRGSTGPLASGATNRNGDFRTNQIPPSERSVDITVSRDGLSRDDTKDVVPRILFPFRPAKTPSGWVTCHMAALYAGKPIFYKDGWYHYQPGEVHVFDQQGRVVKAPGAFVPRQGPPPVTVASPEFGFPCEPCVVCPSTLFVPRCVIPDTIYLSPGL